MNNEVQFKPDRYHTVTPYLIVQDTRGLIEFIQQALDGQDLQVMENPDGSIMHAEIQVGDSVLMISQTREGDTPKTAMLLIYVEDVDSVYRKALNAGASSLQELRDELHGDRMAAVKDAFGNEWWIATHIEDVSAEEMQRRVEAMANQPAQ